jgi:hypothetical protein
MPIRVHWYWERILRRFTGIQPALHQHSRRKQDLKEALRHSEWVVISNFEPEQKPYVFGLLNRITAAPGSAESAARFQSGGTLTIVLRSDWL